MITIEDVKKWSKPHPMSKYLSTGGGKGRVSRFGNKEIEFCIVGGGQGLYGDFDKTFEVAIFDVQTKEFITKYFYPDATHDILSYMNSDDVEKLVNSIIKREDLSIEV